MDWIRSKNAQFERERRSHSKSNRLFYYVHTCIYSLPSLCMTFQGAFAGTITSFVFMLWIGVGAYVKKPVLWKAPISLKGCNWNLTLSDSLNSSITTNMTSLTSSSIYNASLAVTKRYVGDSAVEVERRPLIPKVLGSNPGSVGLKLSK